MHNLNQAKPLPNNNQEPYSRWSPFIFAGAGLSILNNKRDWSNFNTIAFDDKTSTAIGLGIDTSNPVPKVIAVLPVGAGVEYMVSPSVAITAEITYRITASDYLDGFKYAANPKNKDEYYGISVRLKYSLSTNKNRCPTVR